MKHIVLIIAMCAILLGCNNREKEPQHIDVEKAILNMHTNNGIDTDGMSTEYDRDKQEVRLSMNGDVLDVSYTLRLIDMSGDSPRVSADGFIVSMFIIDKGLTDILNIEFVIHGVKTTVAPSHVEKLKDDMVFAGLFMTDEPYREITKILSQVSYIDDIYIVTNKGRIRVPMNDVFNLLSMARSYIMDGGLMI